MPLPYRILDDFIDAGTCAQLLACTTAPALAAAGLAQTLDRCGRSAELPVAGDPLLEDLVARITAAVGLANAHPETLRFREYLVGQGHPEHLDHYQIADAHLIVTALLSLEDTAAGGETCFPAAGLRVPPRAGRLLIWRTLDACGRPLPESAHLAAEVTAGSKRTLAWFVYATPEQLAAAAPGAALELGAVDPAAWRPAHTLTVIDDGVPAETVDLLADACAARRVGFQILDPADLDFRHGPLPPGSLLFCPATSHAAAVAERQLFGPGVATFYRDPTWGPLRDCVAPEAALERAGLPVPRGAWILSRARDRLRALVDWVGGLPVILKIPGGEGGAGVLRASTWPDLFALVDALRAQGVTPRLMSFLQDALHWRLVVVGDAVVAAYPNPTPDNDFRSEPADDTDHYTATPDPAWAALAVEASRALGYAFAGVDLMVHPSGRAYLLEVNSPCYYPQAQLAADLDIAGPMVDHLLATARALAARPPG